MLTSKKTALSVVLMVSFSHLATSQAPLPAAVYRADFNSSFKLTPSQIQTAQLDNVLVETIENIVNADRSQFAFGGPRQDDFYTIPPLTNTTGPLKPGQLLKVQPFTDPRAYAIPPNTALSRIMYTTTNFNGTVIPTSGFIFWPFIPRNSRKKAPVVVWAHGTSGFFGQQAPSAHRSLWYDHKAPFTLVLAGYAVFAPDYAGLGVSASWDGSPIPHQYHASPATAHDALYGLRAALKAFPDTLGVDFIVMGHSQGGAAAWAVAEALALEPQEFADLSPGYNGAIAASPTTRVFEGLTSYILPSVGQMLHSIFPSFQPTDWLTDLGAAQLQLAREIEGGIGVLTQLMMTGNNTVRQDYNKTWYADAFARLGDAGRKDFKGPLLVLQGDQDPLVWYNVTMKTVEETCKRFPHRDLEVVVAKGVGHTPVLDATRPLWLRWIEDRFDGKPLAGKGGMRTELMSFLPVERYMRTGNSVPLWAGLPEFGYLATLSV
ncbi:Alpha/Beta hydrolase protein [Apodospora peruviana]|uniref:Alpha/Beta hydrolase protein n=1 Tax=Apodospora peruviana TaxID=516989 RepID=A0AAE0HXS4_9PEZI|nr:Alpha/Beta hydrolase protein [Apodospora peruviana]